MNILTLTMSTLKKLTIVSILVLVAIFSVSVSDAYAAFNYSDSDMICEGDFFEYGDGLCTGFVYPTVPTVTYPPPTTPNPVSTTPVLPTPTVSITATPSTIESGRSSQLGFTSSNVTSCSINNGIGSVTANTTGTRTVSPTSSTTYTITCQSESGSVTAERLITVTAVPEAFTAYCSAGPDEAQINETIQWSANVSAGGGAGALTWKQGNSFTSKVCTGGQNSTAINNTCPDDTMNGTSCSVEGERCRVSSGCDGQTFTDGEGQNNAHTTYGGVTPYTCTAAGSSNATYTYSWSGTNGLTGTTQTVSKAYTSTGTKSAQTNVTASTGGTAVATCSAQISDPTPIVTLNATPSSINAGNSSTLAWNSTNAVSCVGTGFNTAGNTSGSVSTGALAATTQYSVMCTGPGTTSTGATSGVWRHSYDDISDFYCNAGQTRVSSLELAYSGLAWCPTNPEGKACSGVGDQNVCKINRANNACQIETAVYQCVGASSSGGTTTTTPGSTASAYATVNVNGILSASCAPSSMTPSPGSTVTWTVTPLGGSGNYTYSWSGTEGLSGTGTSVQKSYSSQGIKTASVVVTDTSVSNTTTTGNPTTTTTNTPNTTTNGVSVALQGAMQCSGGTKVGSSGDTQDGVGFTEGIGGLVAECNEITPAGGCCNVEVREKVSPTGQPINTFYFYDAYTGASLVRKDSYSSGGGGSNQTNYNFFAGFGTANTNTTNTTTTTTTPGGTTTTTGTGSSAATATAQCTTNVCSGASCVTPPTPPTPPAPPAPPTPPTSGGVSALLTAFPSTIVRGTSATLSWISANATSCTGGGFATGDRTSGTTTVSPLSTTFYTLTCRDAAGNNAYSSATVSVVAPTLSLRATPALVRTGDRTTITWSVAGAVDACSISGPGISSSLKSGVQSVTVSGESTYTFSCIAGSFNPSVSTTVRVLPGYREI